VQIWVVFYGKICPSGGAESRDARVLPLQVLGALEELCVLGVGARPATFNVTHPKVVESFRDADLVDGCEGHTFTLATVT
jgi:hypothetical protein